MQTSAGTTRNLYEDPSRFQWADSFEGVPETVGPAEAAPPGAGRLTAVFDQVALALPGVAMAGLLAAGAREGSRWLGVDLLDFERSPVSPILLAILLGLAIRNLVGLPASYDLGLRFCIQKLLRVGVALLGIRLSLAAVGEIGLVALPLVLCTIATALLLVSVVNRALGLPARLGTLIAVGTAICGNSAILATGPAIGAKEDEVSYAVGCVTLFGLSALLVHPFLSHTLFGGDATQAGLFLGLAIHDTAQVAGAGLLYLQQFGAPEALETATVTKLLRNLFMVLVIPGVAWWHHRQSKEGARISRPSLRQAVPGFVLGFLALALLRSLGDLGDTPFGGVVTGASWASWIEGASWLSAWLLALAMAAVGLGTDLHRLRELGHRPLAVGFVAAAAVGAMGAGLIHLVA